MVAVAVVEVLLVEVIAAVVEAMVVVVVLVVVVVVVSRSPTRLSFACCAQQAGCLSLVVEPLLLLIRPGGQLA